MSKTLRPSAPELAFDVVAKAWRARVTCVPRKGAPFVRDLGLFPTPEAAMHARNEGLWAFDREETARYRAKLRNWQANL